MLRAEKSEVIDDLHRVLSGTGVVVVTHYKGLTVAELGDLRRSLRAAGGTFRVTKNRLARRALEGTPYASIADLFKGPTAIAVSTDPVAAPKAVVEYARKNDKLAIVGGGLGNVVLDQAAVRSLAELPSLDQIRATLIALVQTPASRIASILQAPGGQVARALRARADKLGEG